MLLVATGGSSVAAADSAFGVSVTALGGCELSTWMTQGWSELVSMVGSSAVARIEPLGQLIH